MKRTEKDFKKWIERQVKYYSPYLGLSLQKISVIKNEVDDNRYLHISLTYPYFDPNICFSDRAFRDFQNNIFQKDRILHELCHCLTDPLYCKATERYIGKNEIEDERERLTDKITIIIRNILER
jgi:hypothetical protein